MAVAETLNVKSLPVVTCLRMSALALAASLVACSSIDNALSGDKVDYRSPSAKSKGLEIPPDLTQLARESRYQVQGGVVSASGAAAAGVATPGAAPAAAPAAATVAPDKLGNIRVERLGQQRWLVTDAPPEVLWPQIKAFWIQRGFVIETEEARTGLMETGWAENRAKLPDDVVRNTIGTLFNSLYDTGERDRFRTRVERTATGSEIYISHRGLAEVYIDQQRENTSWRPRPTDPNLEADMLARMMMALAPKDEPVRAQATAQAQARAQVVNAPETPPRARVLEGAAAVLEIDEPFDRAWRRVGQALDRGGFTVEDRDRTAGLYYVRYVDPKSAGKEEPGWWMKLIGDGTNPQLAVKYRIFVKGSGSKSMVAVMTSAGAAETGENGKNIAGLLVKELR